MNIKIAQVIALKKKNIMINIKKWAKYSIAAHWQCYPLWWSRIWSAPHWSELNITLVGFIRYVDHFKVICKIIFLPKHYFTHKLEMFDGLIGLVIKDFVVEFWYSVIFIVFISNSRWINNFDSF